LYKVAVSVIDKLGDIYPNLIKKREEIQSIILKEEKQFGETLEK
jgi:alanyl-tRNA synthetase